MTDRRAKARRALLADALNIAPSGILYTALLIGPGALAIVLSFFRWNGIGDPVWVGLANWQQLLGDSQVFQSLGLTFGVTAMEWLIVTVIAVAAGLSTAGAKRSASILAALFILPLLISTTGIGLIWGALLSPELGGIAFIGTALHLPFLNSNWLGDPALVVVVITLIMSWQHIPFYTLMYRVARQRVPEELYEAARLDGAGDARQLISVTLPQIRSTIVSGSLLLIITSVAYFDLFFLLTGGGPGTASMVLGLYTYKQGFQSQNFGYASTLTVVLVTISVVLGAILLIATRFSTESREGGE